MWGKLLRGRRFRKLSLSAKRTLTASTRTPLRRVLLGLTGGLVGSSLSSLVFGGLAQEEKPLTPEVAGKRRIFDDRVNPVATLRSMGVKVRVVDDDERHRDPTINFGEPPSDEEMLATMEEMEKDPKYVFYSPYKEHSYDYSRGIPLSAEDSMLSEFKELVAEFIREKFTDRFNTQPDSVLPTYRIPTVRWRTIVLELWKIYLFHKSTIAINLHEILNPTDRYVEPGYGFYNSRKFPEDEFFGSGKAFVGTGYYILPEQLPPEKPTILLPFYLFNSGLPAGAWRSGIDLFMDGLYPHYEIIVWFPWSSALMKTSLEKINKTYTVSYFLGPNHFTRIGVQNIKRQNAAGSLPIWSPNQFVYMWTPLRAFNPFVVIHKQLMKRATSFVWYSARTRVTQGPLMLDMKRMNRDLSKVLFLNNQSYYEFDLHKENYLYFSTGNFWWIADTDVDLLDLLPVLLQIADESKKRDIREVLQHYKDIDIFKLAKLASGRPFPKEYVG